MVIEDSFLLDAHTIFAFGELLLRTLPVILTALYFFK